MPSDSGDRLSSKPQNSGNPPSDHDSIPCPRCDSTSTKFCYYNNYNLSQPRHFCKSCRRYWTQGGTLRNIPVGGGTRKTAKRSRTSPSSTTTTTTSSCSSVSYPHYHQNQEATHHRSEYYNNGILVKPISFSSTDSISVKSDMSLAPLRCDINLNNVNINVSAGGGGGGFTSLLNSNTEAALQVGDCGGGGGPSPPQQPPPPQQTGSGFLALGGFGLGLGSGFEDIGFEYGTKGFWAPLESVAAEAAGSGTTWLVGSGGSGHVGGGAGDVDGGFVDGDHPYFAWPDLAISTTRKGLK